MRVIMPPSPEARRQSRKVSVEEPIVSQLSQVSPPTTQQTSGLPKDVHGVQRGVAWRVVDGPDLGGKALQPRAAREDTTTYAVERSSTTACHHPMANPSP
jgi:hypothetical protein